MTVHSPVATIEKDPGAVLYYGFDWATWLASNADPSVIIDTSTWICPGLTVSSPSKTTTTTTLWLAGGKHGEDYYATNQITLSDGQVEERTFCVQVRQR